MIATKFTPFSMSNLLRDGGLICINVFQALCYPQLEC